MEHLLWQWPLALLDAGMIPKPSEQAGVDFVIEVGGFREAKKAGIEAHRTQQPGLRNLFNSDAGLSIETFPPGLGSPTAYHPRTRFVGISQQ